MLKQNVSLKDFSNYKIGGSALYFLEVTSKEELIQGLREWDEASSTLPQSKQKIFVLGGGTNILFSDKGFEGLVIKNSIKGVEKAGEEIFVGAGEEVGKIVDFCIENSLSGMEWAGGLPGTMGGAIRGNAGAFGGETKDNITQVTSFNLKTGELIKRENKDCDFSYRWSTFKEKGNEEIILSAVISLKRVDQKEIIQKTTEKIEYRKERHPLEHPNIGSIFKNVPLESVPEELRSELGQYMKNDPFPVIPAAKLIFLAGLRGKRIGNVMVSEKHTNFIVNLGEGKQQEVTELIEVIKKEIKNKFSISLEEEIMFVGGDLNG